VPIPDSCIAAKSALLDHLVGAGEQHRSPTHAAVTRRVSLLGVFYRCDMIIMQVTRRTISLSSSTHFPDERVLTIDESASTGSPCASRQNQDFRSGEPPGADQPATRPRFNCIRGRSYARGPGFRELSKAPRACELRADEPIRTYGSCHHVDGSSPSDLRDCDRAPLNVLSTRACARTYPRHSPASPDCARLCPSA